MKQVRYYYVRHGQTLFNRLGRMQGWCDSPLTEQGIKDAEAAAERLKDIPFSHIYSSVSGRCMDTAAIINNGRNIPITYHKELREYGFGLIEGMKTEDHLDLIDPIRFTTFDWTPYEGENLEMVMVRARRILDRIYDESSDGDNVLIISHGAFFLHLLDGIFGLDRLTYLQAVREGPKEYLPAPNGFVGIFACTDGVFKMEYLDRRSPELLETLNTNRR